MKKNISILFLICIVASLVSCGHEHQWGEWETVKEATSLEEGEKTRRCECGEIEIQFIPTLDHDGTLGLSFELLSNGTYSVSYGEAKSSEIIIPSKYKGKNVTKIADNAFKDKDLISITIPSTITSIGSNAFQSCSFTSLTIPDSVVTIGFGALRKCNKLEELTIPFAGSSKYASADTAYFGFIFGCENNTYQEIALTSHIPRTLSTVTITSATSIGERAFAYCESIDYIHLPNTLSRIDAYAFQKCGIKEIVIPGSINYMGTGVFAWCEKLQKATFEQGVKSIETMTFHLCVALNEIYIPDSVYKIGEYAFWKCTSLTSITIPESVTTISKGAFDDCTNLSSVIFENSTGWKIQGYSSSQTSNLSSSKLSDKSTAATYLAKTYTEYNWIRTE